ncbi:Z1 domain-containing protein [Schwartzia succinivorans]|jgi:hypothetical protein|uniref:Z1 domain-containing protein n=1 Tax=Schwartzia succinivorans DSM 10502 TaxID=1123243 RepID=A0A1M4VCY4_9FIRM|nr:Z1 domain-containing protein [Schwartzia succinivorans]SHE66809.1 Z1 domain-containing protein [Schwartzia succinivorans DSM 10502]
MINDIGNKDRYEQNLYRAAVLRCIKLVKDDNEDIKNAVEEVAVEFSRLVKDVNNLKNFLYQEVTQEGSTHPVIMTENVRQRDWWNNRKKSNDIPMGYVIRYFDYLSAKPGWSEMSIKDLDVSTDEVMNALANPTLKKADERRGLVYGDVQSGKTAHYIGLINKAYSAGYKIIIVLTGMQNSLRSQTQARVDEEVLGYETSNEISFEEQLKQNVIGVGTVIPNADVGPLQSITNRDEKGDFNKKLSTGSFMPPFIIITKKVSSVLKYIISSLSKNTITKVINGKKIIPASYPALIIDDEADQASINTKDVEKTDNPSTINGLIRKLLNLFECKSYVGYTATPFANIFIPYRTDDDIYGKDLFPKDFIAKAPRPELYVGAREFFGLGEEEIKPMPLMRMISAGQSFLSQGTKKDDYVGELPSELKEAIKFFFISTAIRNLRGQRNKPNTMLIHIVRFVDQQKTIKKKIDKYVREEIFNFISYGDGEIRKAFENIYFSDFVPTTKEIRVCFSKYSQGCNEIDFDSIWKEITRLVSAKELKIWAINGKSDDSLIYKNYKDQPFNVIAIGGDKLSRGLTLEGLTISYFTRAASAMDTLLQMGRWFGYRPAYLDVCRIFTTQDLFNKFKIISYSVANLSAQFDDMNTLKSDPEHFGLKVATNPEILISARNKVRTGADYQADFSNHLTQTRLIDADPEIIEENYQTVNNFLSSLDSNRFSMGDSAGLSKYIPSDTKTGKTYWIGVPGALVADFFDKYHTSKTATKASSRHIADYIREMQKYNGLTDWTVCLCGTDKNNTPTLIATESKFGPIKVNGIVRNRSAMNEKNKEIEEATGTTRDLHALISGGDEELDYTADQHDLAKNEKENLKKKTRDNQFIAREVRRVVRTFDHGFLLLYPIEWAAEDLKAYDNKAPYGFAVVFPDRQGKGNLKSYKLNEVAMELDDYE